MFKLSIIGLVSLAGFASAQLFDTERFLQTSNATQAADPKIPFRSTLGCGACIRGGYIFCIPGPEGSNRATWGTLRPNCYQDSTALTAANLASQYTCSNSYADPTLAKALCPFDGSKCGANQNFDFGDVGEQTSINITMAAGDSCTYQIKTECGLPAFKPSTTSGFEIENVDYDDDDLADDNSTRTLRMLERDDNKGKRGEKGERESWRSNKTTDERKKQGFKADKEPPKLKRNRKFNRNSTDDDDKDRRKGKGPKFGRFDPSKSEKGRQKFKGGNRKDKTEPLCKPRYQQISVTALGNLTSNSSRILQSDIYTMTLEIGSEDFSGALNLFFSASVLVFSILTFF